MADTSTGLQENVAGVLCYVLGWISGIVFLLLEPNNKFVRFHAFQSIIVFAVLTLIAIVFSWIPWLGTVILWLVWVVGFIVWIISMVLASQGKKHMLPWAGNLAEKWAG